MDEVITASLAVGWILIAVVDTLRDKITYVVISPEKVTRYLQDVGICMCFISMCLATTYCFKGYVRNSFKLLKGQNIMRLYSGFNKPFRFTFIFVSLHLFSTFGYTIEICPFLYNQQFPVF